MPEFRATYEVMLGTESGSFGSSKRECNIDAPTFEEASKQAKSIRKSRDGETHRSQGKFTTQHWDLKSVEPV